MALREIADSPFLPAGHLPDAYQLSEVIQRLGGVAAIFTEGAAEALGEFPSQVREFLLLVVSVHLQGVIKPPTVRRTSRGLELVIGHRCVLAAPADPRRAKPHDGRSSAIGCWDAAVGP